MPPKFARFAALGAVGVSFGAVALWALLAFVAMPGPANGIDGTHAMLTWISTAVPVVLIIAVHLAFGVHLWRYGSRGG